MTLSHIMLKDRVMKRVYRLWVMRQAAHSVLLKLALIMGLALELRELVSVRNVVENTLQLPTLSTMMSYTAYAFTHTHFAVQFVLMLVAGLVAFTLADVFKKDFQVSVV